MSNYKSTPSLLLIFFSSFLIANLGFLPLNAQEEAVSEPEEYEEISEKTEQFLNQELHPKNKLNKKSWKKNSETFDFREEKQKEEEDKQELSKSSEDVKSKTLEDKQEKQYKKSK
jgi:rRNA maturation endonuclease Nob1